MTKDDVIQLLVAEMQYVLDCINKDKVPFDGDDFHEALSLGRQAIEQAQKQEPVAWMNGWGDLFKHPDDAERGQTMQPLYTSPPQRQWVGLTDEEMKLIDPDGFEDNLPQMIQQALKEKNT